MEKFGVRKTCANSACTKRNPINIISAIDLRSAKEAARWLNQSSTGEACPHCGEQLTNFPYQQNDAEYEEDS